MGKHLVYRPIGSKRDKPGMAHGSYPAAASGDDDGDYDDDDDDDKYFRTVVCVFENHMAFSNHFICCVL